MRFLRPTAYGAGYRAGMSPRVVITMPDGTKRLGDVPCPYTTRRQVLQRMAWNAGYHDGTVKNLNQWLKSRKGPEYAKH